MTIKRNKVFISYSRKDKGYLEELNPHLDFLNKHYEINSWSDKKIKSGSLWREEIRQALETTRVAILLVSSNFLSSEFINNEELPSLLTAAQSDGVRILLLIIRPCMIQAHPELSKYQFVNSTDTSVNKLSEANRDELYTRLVEITLAEMSKPLLASKAPQKEGDVAREDVQNMEKELLKWLILFALQDGGKVTSELGSLLPSYKRKDIVEMINDLKLKHIVIRKRIENRTFFYLSEAGSHLVAENRSRIAFFRRE